MHRSSMESMGKFFDTLDKDKILDILDVGSCLANGQTDTYKNRRKTMKKFISKLWDVAKEVILIVIRRELNKDKKKKKKER